MSLRKITIGNAGGYWGDDPTALRRQVEGGPLDYISMDFLAEITMSIMQKQRSRDPESGYAKDFLPMIESVFKQIIEKQTTVITNAGGINPVGCAEAILAIGKKLGLSPKIAVVDGDDILADIDKLESQGAKFTNMETGDDFASVKSSLLAANTYFGATPVVAALEKNPNIVITGRVTDTGITLASMIKSFGWALNDWDRLAAGIVAGHILECGSQSTGGNFTDWHKVSNFKNIGFPIVEMYEDGSFIVKKHPGTGGLVSVDTVREQLFYEMGDPKGYITPDVVADFSSIKLSQEGEDQVRVSGVKGFEPTPFYKVSMAYEDGFKCLGTIAISGPNAREKAEAFSEIFWEKLGPEFKDTETEFFGWNACQRSLVGKSEANEIILRLGVRSQNKEELRAFSKLVPSIILAGPPGVTVTGGAPKPAQIVSYWPALINKEWLKPRVRILDDQGLGDPIGIQETPIGQFSGSESEAIVAEKASQTVDELFGKPQEGTPLEKIALARSGDKGDTSNIGILARSQKAYEFLGEHLTPQVVKNLFQELCFGKVTRYELPNMLGYNFLLEESLGGGGTKTLRVDAQGKTFGQALLAQKMRIPDEILQEL